MFVESNSLIFPMFPSTWFIWSSQLKCLDKNTPMVFILLNNVIGGQYGNTLVKIDNGLWSGTKRLLCFCWGLFLSSWMLSTPWNWLTLAEGNPTLLQSLKLATRRCPKRLKSLRHVRWRELWAYHWLNRVHGGSRCLHDCLLAQYRNADRLLRVSITGGMSPRTNADGKTVVTYIRLRAREPGAGRLRYALLEG